VSDCGEGVPQINGNLDADPFQSAVDLHDVNPD